MNLTFDYFKEEVLRFRKLFGSSKNSLEDLERAFVGLSYVYFNVVCEDEKEEDSSKKLFNMIVIEWERRRKLMFVNFDLEIKDE